MVFEEIALSDAEIFDGWSSLKLPGWQHEDIDRESSVWRVEERSALASPPSEEQPADHDDDDPTRVHRQEDCHSRNMFGMRLVLYSRQWNDSWWNRDGQARENKNRRKETFCQSDSEQCIARQPT